MPKFNYAKAKAAGYTDEQIAQYLSQKPDVEVVNKPEAPVVTPAARQAILSQAGPITQQFGNYNPEIEKYSGGINYGTDIGVNEGTQLNLPEGEWEVEEQGTGFNSGYGNSILVRNAETGEKLRFSHLSKMKRFEPKQRVRGGEMIAYTGNTGNSTGPHLDLEYIDPMGRHGDVLKSKYKDSLY